MGKLLRKRKWKCVEEINCLSLTWQPTRTNYIVPTWALSLIISVSCQSHKQTEIFLHFYFHRYLFINANNQSSAWGAEDRMVQGDMITPSHMNQLAATSVPAAMEKSIDVSMISCIDVSMSSWGHMRSWGHMLHFLD